MMRRRGKAIPMRRAACAAAAALAFVLASSGVSQERRAILPRDESNPLKELISGYYFTPLDTRALQDDDFDNPGFAWVGRGEAAWSQVEGTARKSCASCHRSAAESMRGKAAEYPKFDARAGRVVTLEDRINLCRYEKLGAPAWAYESDELLGMTAYLRLQSRGLPMSVKVDGEARPLFEKGKALYEGRMGQLGMSCASCHNSHYGQTYRNRTLSQGHINGFPTFRRDPPRFSSAHAQLSTCYRLMRAEPHPSGAEDYVALELYLGWRGNGLPIEAPSVRR